VADEVHEVAASPSVVFSSYSDNFLATGVEVQIVDASGQHPFPVKFPILLDTDNIAMSTPNPEDEDPTVAFSLTDDRRDDLAVDDAVADVRSRRHGRLTRGGAGPDADVLEGPEGG